MTDFAHKPIYTEQVCSNPAYQLDWSYSLFWRNKPKSLDWLEPLKEVAEKDHVRIMQHSYEGGKTSQFLISTRPNVMPVYIAQRLKGRLQHLIRDTMPDTFQRNYSLRSIGSTRRDKLEQYLSIQLAHHPTADSRVQDRLARYQIHCPEVDLSKPRQTNRARFWYNVHLVLINDSRNMEISDKVLQQIHDMILKVTIAKGHLLSRAAIVPDHIHITLGCELSESPESVALSYMNNIAYACGMNAVFKESYYVGTFSEYDLGVIPRP